MQISPTLNLLGQRCFSNNPIITVLVVHVQARCWRRIDWIIWWRLLYRWSTSWWWLIPMIMIIIISLIKRSESKDTPRVRNPGGFDRIVNPIVQIINTRGGLYSACGCGIPLPAVSSLHLQMKIMDHLHNTKMTTP